MLDCFDDRRGQPSRTLPAKGDCPFESAGRGFITQFMCRGNLVEGRHYCLVVPRLESACVALCGTRMVGLSGCLVSAANLAGSRHQRNPLNIKAKRVG